jgi:hypothetical protein
MATIYQALKARHISPLQGEEIHGAVDPGALLRLPLAIAFRAFGADELRFYREVEEV